jgi:hypothetical protein
MKNEFLKPQGLPKKVGLTIEMISPLFSYKHSTLLLTSCSPAELASSSG